jgi:transposase, IS30 family
MVSSFADSGDLVARSTSFLMVTQEHLDYAIHLLNNGPRKCLNWETPYQVLAEELLRLV